MIREPEVIVNNRHKGEIAINIVELLTWYPLFFVVAILFGSYIKSTPFIYLIMFTWLIAFYVGALLWLILTIWLVVEKIMSLKKALIYFLIASAGIALSACVWIYDIFNYGFRYFD